jgi:thiamine biosynthesis lipoprotein
VRKSHGFWTLHADTNGATQEKVAESAHNEIAVARRIFALHSALLTLNFLFASACGSEGPPVPVMREYVAMGSQLKVTLWATDEAKAIAAADRVSREFDRLESLLSIWKPESDVVRLNAAAGRAPVAVSRETLDVLAAARAASEMTGGKFDITFGALADIWKFDHDQDNTLPDAAAITARLPLVDYQAVQVDAAKGTAFISRAGARVHLGGIGKGYALDLAVTMLQREGFRDFLLQAGGDMYAAGTNNGTPWTLGIADPRGAHDAFAAVTVRDATFSTSGDYERFFLKDGIRYHHLLDPDRGEPARGSRSVTIVADRAVIADVLSTGVFIMGPLDGMALIERLPNVEGVIVTASNEVLISSGLKDRVEMRGRPTDAP